ncbi:MAG: hypothetical protein IJ404_01210 [Clostridia bacterium]|nr:hypothetical protein [Clostridia bacterium]
MKKILSLTLTFLMLVTLFVGCKGNNGSSQLNQMNGSEVAKLLLANERLNAQLLKNDGDIFENGVKVMNTLAKIATANLSVRSADRNTFSTAKLSAVKKTSTVLEGDYSGKVEITDDAFFWSEFEENNNSYDYFKHVTDNIVIMADFGAELIDDVKKNVRVVDKWVNVGGTHYYLHVDENGETLYEKDTANDFLKICKRYKNDEGKDVYELYTKQGTIEERMTYIPGERYELSMLEDFGNTYFTADNSKGYWETYVVNGMSEHYNVSYFIMKNDICYDAFYDPQNKSISMLKVMSSDKKTDILNYFDGEDFSSIDLKLCGFDGIKSVEAPASSVEYNESTGLANLSNGSVGKLHLTNGKTLAFGDSFADDKVSVNSIHVGYIGGFGYTGEMSLRIGGETYAERLEALKSFLNETGLQCRRNIDSVLSGIDRALTDLESVIKYYKWNDVSVSDEAGLLKAESKEKTRFEDMEALYTAIKDAEVLDISDTKLIDLNINFAPITDSSFDGVTLDAVNVSVGGASLTIKDTTLFVEGESYKLAFALADSDAGLAHFEIENTSSIKYAGENTFTVTASDLKFTLSSLSSGSYTLVAYIATLEGIRTSAYIPVTVNETVNMPVDIENMTVSAENTDENGTLTLSYEQKKDFTVTLITEGRIGYEEFRTAVSELAFEYGIPSDTIELVSGDTYTALEGNEAEIADGTYRISYEAENGGSVTQGYIYVQYSCK